MLTAELLNYHQLKTLVAHRNADQVLSQAMASLLHGAGFKSQFEALEQLRANNVDNCAAKLRSQGLEELYLEQGIAQNFAEAFAHHWPKEQAIIDRSMDYVHNTATAA